MFSFQTQKKQTQKTLTISILNESFQNLLAQERKRKEGSLFSAASRQINPPSCTASHEEPWTKDQQIWDLSSGLLAFGDYCFPLETSFYFSGSVSSSVERKIPSSYQSIKLYLHAASVAAKEEIFASNFQDGKDHLGNIWTSFWDYIMK